MTGGGRKVTAAYEAHERGEFKPLLDLLHPDVVWLGIEGRNEDGTTPCCENRSAVISRLARLYERGRKFRVVEEVGDGQAVAVGIELADPSFPANVTVWKVFRFDSTGRVIQMQDCVSREEAIGAARSS